MNTKSNKILLGVIILMIGVFALLQNAVGFQYRDITTAGVGLALLLLYKTKRKNWPLIVGSYLTYIGAVGLLNVFLPHFIMARLIGAMFFIVPGIIFMVLFYDKGKKPLLIPGSILIWFGVFIILGALPFLRGIVPALFFFCIGMGFMTMYVLGKNFVSKFALYFAVILLFFGCVLMGGIFPGVGFIRRIPSVGAIALIVAAIALIVSALRKN